MPPIIAILLALLTKEVYLSLFAGCALGALLVAEFHPWVAFDTLFNTMIDSVDFSILMFMILLGMVVMLMQESGGTRAYGEWAAKKLKSKRATLVATSLLGALIFVDDYFNCLTVGSVMRPVTDKYKVSRAKLAYLIDATAAPVCIIAPISSWAAAVNSYVPAGSSMSGFEMFVRTIPFNLYAMLTLYMDLIGLFGGSVVGATMLGVSYESYFDGAFRYTHNKDLWVGLLKAFIFGLIIVCVSCYQGFTTTEGAVGVGRATRRTVVVSFLLILTLGYFVTRLAYQ